jgi:hypothetical protein
VTHISTFHSTCMLFNIKHSLNPQISRSIRFPSRVTRVSRCRVGIVVVADVASSKSNVPGSVPILDDDSALLACLVVVVKKEAVGGGRASYEGGGSLPGLLGAADLVL